MNQASRPCVREITACYDASSILVYQAFSDLIADAACRQGRFGDGFRMTRCSWIKPNLGWMLYRSGYARKPRQERVLSIRLSRKGFDRILELAELHQPECPVHTVLLRTVPVVCQWDPYRDLLARKVWPLRAIQLGLRDAALHAYVHDWCLGIEDITSLVHAVAAAVDGRGPMPEVPLEQLYPVSPETARRLGMEV